MSDPQKCFGKHYPSLAEASTFAKTLLLSLTRAAVVPGKVAATQTSVRASRRRNSLVRVSGWSPDPLIKRPHLGTASGRIVAWP